MNIHPTTVYGHTGDKSLGVEIVKLRYDLLLEVLMGMVDEIERQAYHDLELGRKKLSRALFGIRLHLIHVETAMNEVVRICNPYILAEKKLIRSLSIAPTQVYASQNQAFTGYTFRL